MRRCPGQWSCPCSVPSERLIVPSWEDLTEPVPTGLPLVVSGGHALAQAPEQLDMPFESATHRYNARPPAPVRNVPSLPLVTLTAAPLDAAGVAVALVLAVALEPAAPEPVVAAVLAEPLEPHAATSTLTPTSAVTAPILYLILRSFCMFTPGGLGYAGRGARHQPRRLARGILP